MELWFGSIRRYNWDVKIAIDISQVIYGTGVSVYTRELVTNLLKTDKENQYVLFGGSLRRREELKRYTKNVIPLSPTLADLIWNRLHTFGVERFIGNVDVLHSSDWTQPPTAAFKVTTVHDLAPINYPNETPKRIIEVHKRRLYWVMREVDRIIVPTNFVKDELKKLGADEKKIRVIYEAAGENFKRLTREAVNETKKKFGIREDYIMALGIGERKNTKRIIEAYQKSKKNYKLVIVGGHAKTNFDERGVTYTGYISDEDLVGLYSGAKALVYPSLYEGFGLPILQAFACECPVVTSNIGAMKEVADTAAILVDPMDVNSIAEGIDKAVDSPKTLIAKGLKRVKDFSWEKAARETLKGYEESRK